MTKTSTLTTKTRFYTVLYMVTALSLLLVLRVTPAMAATMAITGGTYGASCDSGGYFTPGSVTINSGDTVTISVPAGDPYPGGVQVHGFPQGSFVVARGSSVTTSPITATVSYYGTWPNTGCMKGTGTIMVNHPTVVPSKPSLGAAAGPTSTAKPVPTTHASTTSTPVTSSSTPASTQSNARAADTPAAQSPNPTQVASSHPKTDSAGVSESDTTAKSPGLKNAAAIGGGSLAIIAIGLIIVWRLVARRRLHGASAQPPLPVRQSIPPTEPQPGDVQGDDTVTPVR